jgi:hypothetical protein
MAEMDMWVELIEETRLALATLREEDLEVLAMRAEMAFDERLPATNSWSADDETLRRLTAEHRMLRDLLEMTAGNLAVLRRLQNMEANLQWER